MHKHLASCLPRDKYSVNDGSYHNNSSCIIIAFFSHEWDWETFLSALTMGQFPYLPEDDIH